MKEQIKQRIKNGDEFVIRHPFFGTLNLHETEIVGDYINGVIYNFDTPTGDGCIKESMNFPLSCVYFFK